MAFNSIAYFAFLPLVYALFVVTPAKVRWMPLLVFSFYFYMTFSASLVFFLSFAILLNYFIALLIGGQMFGIMGMLLAVPVTAVLQVFLRSLADYYRDSEFYRGA